MLLDSKEVEELYILDQKRMSFVCSLDEEFNG